MVYHGGQNKIDYIYSDNRTRAACATELRTRWLDYMKMRVAPQQLLAEVRDLAAQLRRLEDKVDALAYAPGMPAVKALETDFDELSKRVL